MPQKLELPKYDDLYKPTLEALLGLGGSASIEELNESIAKSIGATQEQLDQIYQKSSAPILFDRMAWARSWMKMAGLTGNPKRGVWVLTDKGRDAIDQSALSLKQKVNGIVNALCFQKGARPATH